MPSEINQLKGKLRRVVEKKRFQWKGFDKGIHVLTYHGVIKDRTHPRLQRNFHTESEFRNHMLAIKKCGGHVISPHEFEQRIEEQDFSGISKGFLLTFDDGYVNNLRAFELMNEFKFDSVLFVSSGCIGTNYSIWTVNLSLLILYGNLDWLDFNKTFQLKTFDQRKKCLNEIRAHLKSIHANDRIQQFQFIQCQFPSGELERLLDEHKEFKMMDWSQLRSLDRKKVDIQSHGVDHELFHANQKSEVVKNEVCRSKKQIERELNTAVKWFAYANGDDQCPSVEKNLRGDNYSLGFSLGQTKLDPSSNRFFLPRYDARQSTIQYLF